MVAVLVQRDKCSVGKKTVALIPVFVLQIVLLIALDLLRRYHIPVFLAPFAVLLLLLLLLFLSLSFLSLSLFMLLDLLGCGLRRKRQ